jgi:ATP-binding cassette subfamily B protein
VTSRSALASIRDHLAAHRASIAWGILFLAFSNLFGRSVLWVLKAGIDSLRAPASSSLLFYAGLIVGLTALQGGFRFWGRWTLVGMARDIEFALRNRLYSHLQSLAPSFYSRTPTGDLMSRATQDLNVIRQLFGAGIMYTVGTGITYLSTIPIMALIDPGLTLLALLPFPFLLATLLRSQSIVHERFEEVQESFTQLTERAQENLSGIRLVKAYVMEEREADEFARINEEYVSRNLRLARVDGLFNGLSSVLAGIGVVVVLWLGGKRVIEGSVSLGGFVAFNGYLITLIWPTIALAWIISVIQRGLVSLKRVNAILDEVPTIRESDRPVPVESLHGEIEFRNLSFTYPGREHPVLKDVTLHIPAGSRIAIVGPTGAGKSSLVQCLPRLLEFPEGRLFLDGVDITRIPLLTLRRSIGYVPQESFLFSDTLRENIAFGRPDATLEEVRGAALTAGLGPELEEFPRGIETMVGERGITLSGGQRQRVTIARALMMNPAILILDDSLSSVDAETEAAILDRLTPVMNERTTLIITHRLTTIQGADLIVVMDDGQIVEVGKHDELLSGRGLYSELWHRQQLLSELESLTLPSPLRGEDKR